LVKCSNLSAASNPSHGTLPRGVDWIATVPLGNFPSPPKGVLSRRASKFLGFAGACWLWSWPSWPLCPCWLLVWPWNTAYVS